MQIFHFLIGTNMQIREYAMRATTLILHKNEYVTPWGNKLQTYHECTTQIKRYSELLSSLNDHNW